MAMSATSRLYIEADLAEGRQAELSADQSHYLGRVMRLSPGDGVRLFNGRDGEFEAEVSMFAKGAATVRIGSKLREQKSTPDVWLLFAPLKKTRTDFVVEKAAELGVREIWPVLTERCEAQTVRTDRLERIAIEAAEQTERLDVPPVRNAAKLHSVLQDWNAARPIYFCDESGDDADRPWGGSVGRAKAMADVVGESASSCGAILIGPEGGFSLPERKMLREQAFVRPVCLGPRILRAETAAVAALALWQAAVGDWRR